MSPHLRGCTSVLLSTPLLGCPGPLPRGDATRPDIVLVSIDSLRADHLSAYGYARPTSPNLDRLANEGLRFEGARAASPWTLPSHMTMLTGRWPTDHNVVESDIALAPEVPLVQEALAGAGYTTAGFVSTIYVSGAYGFSRGFDTWRDYHLTERDNLTHPVRIDALVADALQLAKDKGQGKPLFLFIHIYDVHYPYDPPPPWDTKFDRPGEPVWLNYRTYPYFLQRPLGPKRLEHIIAQYDESIAYVDDGIGRLKQAWDDSDRPAWWIVTSDHGEELAERGSWGHGQTLYREALEIPLIVAGPGIERAVRTERAGTIDLAATMAAMAGLDWPHGPGVDLRGPIPERPFLAETSRFDAARLSLTVRNHRLDLDLGTTGGARTVFDLTTDPLEKFGRADSPQAEALEARLWPLLGEPWVVDAGHEVLSLGQIWTGGGRVPSGTAVPGPAHFGVFPADAKVYLENISSARGVLSAQAKGPLRYEGARTARRITLADDTRAQLEALGYEQGEDE